MASHMNDALKLLSRKDRKRALAEERKRRKSGSWGKWELHTFPEKTVGRTGWPAQIKEAHVNRVFCVLSRKVGAGMTHLAVASLSGERPTFHEMQRIKNEIAGEDRMAVEIYPPHETLVDDADMFHIWVLPPGALEMCTIFSEREHAKVNP